VHIIGRAPNQIFGQVKMNVSMVGQPAYDFAHFGHNFRTNPVAGQN
jgi:hypothetical protein